MMVEACARGSELGRIAAAADHCLFVLGAAGKLVEDDQLEDASAGAGAAASLAGGAQPSSGPGAAAPSAGAGDAQSSSGPGAAAPSAGAVGAQLSSGLGAAAPSAGAGTASAGTAAAAVVPESDWEEAFADAFGGKSGCGRLQDAS